MLKQKTPLQRKTALKKSSSLKKTPLKSCSSLKQKTPLVSYSSLNGTSSLKRTPLKPKPRKTPERTSIVFQNMKKCCMCGAVEDASKGIRICKHEIFFGTANRSKSIEDHMVAPLCQKCHLDGNEAVHKNRNSDLALKRKAQKVWEENYGSREAFTERYGRNYLDED